MATLNSSFFKSAIWLYMFKLEKYQFIVGKNRNLPFSCYSLKAQPFILSGMIGTQKKCTE